jgi:phage terminase large subunit
MNLQIKAGPIFARNYESDHRININRGGTSSSKTGSLIRLFLLWLITWKLDNFRVFEQGTLSIVRKFSATLTKSVQRDFEALLDEYELRWKIDVNKSEKTYRYGKRVIEFIGIDDPQKARGPRRDILYCNEANELTREDFFQLFIRTKYKTYIDFNPDDEDVWINTELEQKRTAEEKDVNVIISTYKDNPFLEEAMVKEIERLERTDPQYWKIYGLGEYGKLEGLIFSFSEIDRVPENAKFVCYWQDFGFVNDPSALVAIYTYDQCVILEEKFYQTGLTNSDIVNMYRSLGVNAWDDVYADSSEPKSIEEIYRHGFNVMGVEKGPDSVKFGIDTMKQYKILVTRDSINLKKELRKYVWKKDKEWKSLNQPIDAFNHAIDAARYGISMKLKKQVEPDIFIW